MREWENIKETINISKELLMEENLLQKINTVDIEV